MRPASNLRISSENHGFKTQESYTSQESPGENVRVFVRIRPLAAQEYFNGQKCALEPVNSNGITIWDPTSFEISNRPELASINPSCWSRSFIFDSCLWSINESDANFATQEKVYDKVGQPIVNWALDGHNCCVFAYGQTGAGKSYTMMGNMKGNASDYGLIPRICFGLFDALDICGRDGSGIESMSLEFSHMEIYNESVKDLLTPSKNGQLRVREHPHAGVMITNLTTVRVANFDEVLSLIKIGDKARTVASTNMNLHSSRSHAIVTLTLRQSFRTSKNDGLQAPLQHKASRIHLVDLAGSERAANSGAKGIRLRETNNINKSLSVLGDVIKSLGERKGTKKAHIPYRNSLLTMVLKDSLGGNSHTVMIAAVSPAVKDYEETMGTLKYADRAKRVRMVVQANIMATELNSNDAAELVPLLTAEVNRLRAMLHAQQKQGQREPVVAGVPAEVRAAVIEMQQRVLELESQLEEREQLIITLVTGRQELDGDIASKEPASARKLLEGVVLPPSIDLNPSHHSSSQANSCPRLDLNAFSPSHSQLISGKADSLMLSQYHRRYQYQFVYRSTNAPGSSVEVIPIPDEECIVGNHADDADLVFKGPEIAPQHCALIPDPSGRVWLCPIEQALVHVNGAPVVREYSLEHGDLLVIGRKLELRFERVEAVTDMDLGLLNVPASDDQCSYLSESVSPRHDDELSEASRQHRAGTLPLQFETPRGRSPSSGLISKGQWTQRDIDRVSEASDASRSATDLDTLIPVRQQQSPVVKELLSETPNGGVWWDQLQRVADDAHDLESGNLRDMLQAVLHDPDNVYGKSPRHAPVTANKPLAFGKSLRQKLVVKQQQSTKPLPDMLLGVPGDRRRSSPLPIEKQERMISGDQLGTASGSTSAASSPSPSPSHSSRGSSDQLDGYSGLSGRGSDTSSIREQAVYASTRPAVPTDFRASGLGEAKKGVRSSSSIPSAAELLRNERMRPAALTGKEGDVRPGVGVMNKNPDENMNINIRATPLSQSSVAATGGKSAHQINVSLLQRLRAGSQPKPVVEPPIADNTPGSEPAPLTSRPPSSSSPETGRRVTPTSDTIVSRVPSESFESEATELENELALMQKALRDRMHRYRELQIAPPLLKQT